MQTLILQGGKVEVILFDDLTGTARLTKKPAREVKLRIEKPLDTAEPVFHPMSCDPLDWIICYELSKVPRKSSHRQMCLFEREAAHV